MESVNADRDMTELELLFNLCNFCEKFKKPIDSEIMVNELKEVFLKIKNKNGLDEPLINLLDKITVILEKYGQYEIAFDLFWTIWK